MFNPSHIIEWVCTTIQLPSPRSIHTGTHSSRTIISPMTASGFVDLGFGYQFAAAGGGRGASKFIYGARDTSTSCHSTILCVLRLYVPTRKMIQACEPQLT